MSRQQIRTVAHCIASCAVALQNCERSKNVLWAARWRTALRTIASEHLPSGSGIDSGCTIDMEHTGALKIVIDTAFHHMNDGGMYDGWTQHKVTAHASFMGLELKISGPDRNDIKEYLTQVFDAALTTEIDFDALLSGGAS